MGIYEELQARGLIAQVTDEERIRDLVNNGKATFYKDDMLGLIRASAHPAGGFFI